MLFQGELEAEGQLFQNGGVYDRDAHIHSLRLPGESNFPMRHFLITLTTQNPFDFPPIQYATQSSSNSIEDYYNKIIDGA